MTEERQSFEKAGARGRRGWCVMWGRDSVSLINYVKMLNSKNWKSIIHINRSIIINVKDNLELSIWIKRSILSTAILSTDGQTEEELLLDSNNHIEKDKRFQINLIFLPFKMHIRLAHDHDWLIFKTWQFSFTSFCVCPPFEGLLVWSNIKKY